MVPLRFFLFLNFFSFALCFLLAFIFSLCCIIPFVRCNSYNLLNFLCVSDNYFHEKVILIGEDKETAETSY